jgi:hypothetical protein
MSHTLAVLLFLLGLSLAMVLSLKLGRRTGRRRLESEGPDAESGLGPLEGAIFGLLGLLVAFTFSGAASRFEVRRQLIVQEANAIATAYLRLDLLPEASQPALRADFRNYLDARIRGYQALPDITRAQGDFAQAAVLQASLWHKAVAATHGGDAQASRLFLPALNDVFDVATAREVAVANHVPSVILGMLSVLALLCSFLAGSATAKSPQVGLVHSLAFPLIFVITLYVILDLEYPSAGLIRLDFVHQVLFDVRRSMD